MQLLNASSDCAQEAGLANLINVTGYALLIFGLLANIGHAVVLIIALKLLRQSNDALHVIVIYSTLLDMTLGGIAYPFSAVIHHYSSLMSAWTCNGVQLTAWVCTTTTCTCVALLSLDRMLFYRAPNRHRALTKGAVGLVCCVTFVMCAGVTSALWFFDVLHTGNSCAMWISRSKLVFYDVFVVAAYISPILLALGTAGYLFMFVYKQRNDPAFPSLPFGRSPKMASILFLFVASLFAAGILLPSRALIAWYTHVHAGAHCLQAVPMLVAWTCECLMKLHPIARPILTLTVLPAYRNALKEMAVRSSPRDLRLWFEA